MRKLEPLELARRRASGPSDPVRHPVVVVLDGIRSAYNVGSVFRTADALGLERVVCCGFTPTPENHAVTKTALGAEQSVPWSRHDDVRAAIEELKHEGYTLAALEQTEDPTPLSAIDSTHFPLALVLGNEVDGVQQQVLDLCDLAIELPQYGSKASLNVAVAFGVAGYGLVDAFRRGRR